MKKILVTGGAGYVGAKLVPALIEQGYEVNVLDWFIYNPNLFNKTKGVNRFQGDIRDEKIVKQSLQGVSEVIHLACVSNDPSAELNKKLTLDVNQNGFRVLLDNCRQKKIEKFLFASSSSVYGISDAENVYEDHPRVPVSLYNISKAWSEDLLFESYLDIPFTIIRPATICGYSERQRLDLAVNLLTAHAITKNKITIFGGDQHRPNLNINDMIGLYIFLLQIDQSKINHQIYNASYANLTIKEIASNIEKELRPKIGEINIAHQISNDPRSYRVNCDKLYELGFQPSYTIQDAVAELYNAFRERFLSHNINDPIYNNVSMMKKLDIS